MTRSVLGALGLAAATVAAWWAWLGRDTTYLVDGNGNTQGPYTTGQVAACLVTIAVLLALAVRFAGLHPLLAAGSVTVALTAAWTINAALSDDSGLFLVGALLVLVGSAVGTAVVAFLADLTRGDRAFTR